MKPSDLDRFDRWAIARGFSDPVKYMAACEAFEAQQVLIDELNARLGSTLPEKVAAIFEKPKRLANGRFA